MEECEVSSKPDGRRIEQRLRVILVGGGVGGGVRDWMMGGELVGGGMC